ncbi:MAG: PDZ domain-containing protein [Terracidiphilus sp.]
MKYFLRPYRSFQVAALLGLALSVTPPGAGAQSSGIAQIIEGPSPLLHSSSQGYLGVLVGDVDSDSASKLKLKEVRGAVVTLIDHDAPAAQVGIRVNDVLLELNGQAVEGAEQFGRMMHEIPAGRKVTLVISRDGNLQTIAVELVDHKKMEQDVWNKLGNSNNDLTPVQSMSILGGGGDVPLSGGFHLPFFGSSLNVGALVEPLTSQMADYLGVPHGLMVKQVERKSEAATAGMKAFDVILKVGTESIATTADWDRALRANQGKPVQVTILRDRKQQTLTLQVDSKHHHAELEDLFPDSDCPLMAALDPDVASELAQQLAGNDSAVQSMQNQAEALRDQLGSMKLEISPEQAEQFRKQAEKLRESLNAGDFQFDQKQLDQLKQQMKQFQGNFKLDPRQTDELRQQMEQMRRQMEEMQARSFGQFV